MKVCIPVVSLEGLSSYIEADPGSARYLQFHDLELQSFEEIDLASEAPAQSFDAVFCTRISRHVFQALRERGVDVYLCDAETVGEALGEFRSGSMVRIPDEVVRNSGGCGGGGCKGHGAEGSEHSHGCHDGAAVSTTCACDGGCHGQEADGDRHAAAGGAGEESHGCGGGSCGCGGSGTKPSGLKEQRPRTEVLKIAVTSQNRKTITEHAGKCRKFWIYEMQGGEVTGKSLLELSIDQSLHEWNSSEVHPLSGVDVLITGSAGDGVKNRLANWGIETIVTEQTDVDTAIALFLATGSC